MPAREARSLASVRHYAYGQESTVTVC